jgi:hypothetical protein
MSKEKAIKKIEGLDWDKHPFTKGTESEPEPPGFNEIRGLLTEDEMAKSKQQQINELRDEVTRLRGKVKEIQAWANDYSLETFPKPDLQKAAEVLKAAGMTLDSVSADNMRQILDDIKNIVGQALKGGDI